MNRLEVSKMVVVAKVMGFAMNSKKVGISRLDGQPRQVLDSSGAADAFARQLCNCAQIGNKGERQEEMHGCA